MTSTQHDEVAREIKRGFVWLGAASAVARVIDAFSTLVVLWFISREAMGLATLAWSVGVFLESFNGFGMATALVQAPSLDRETLASAFWYTMGIATVLVLSVFVCAPFLSDAWDAPTLTPLIRASSLKLLLVGLALVPLQISNRAMRFDRIAVITTLATLGSALSTIGLAALGFEAWALVLGQICYGVVLVVSAYVVEPYLPAFSFSVARVKPLAAFGARVATSGVLYHLYRNADYFFMGRYLGVAAVGLYRVGFDLAMTPTMTVLNVVNRAALPGYSRLQTNRTALAGAFSWTMRSLCLMLVPVTALLAFTAHDILALVDGGRWIDAADVTACLAWAALLRSLAHLFPPLFHASGRPAFAVYDSLLSAALLSALFIAALTWFGGSHGVIVMGWAWLIAAPLLLAALYAFARTLVPLPLGRIVRALSPGLGGLAALVVLGVSSMYLMPASLHPALTLTARGALFLGGYTVYLRVILGMRLKDILKTTPLPEPS